MMDRAAAYVAFWQAGADGIETAARTRVAPDWPWPWDEARIADTFDAVVGADVAGKDVVDYGCGVGRLSREALRRGARTVYGVDCSPGMLARALDYCGDLRFRPILVDPGAPAELPAADVAWSFLVMQHCWNRAMITGALSAMARCLKPGGSLSVQFRRGLPQTEGETYRFEGIAIGEDEVLALLLRDGVGAHVVECRDLPALPSGGLYDWWIARGRKTP